MSVTLVKQLHPVNQKKEQQLQNVAPSPAKCVMSLAERESVPLVTSQNALFFFQTLSMNWDEEKNSKANWCQFCGDG